MDLKTKRLLLRAFYNFIKIIFAIAGKEGVAEIEKAFAKWRATRTPKPKTTKKRKRRKKS